MKISPKSLTHAERRIRRELATEEYANGFDQREVAKKFGITISSVSAFVRSSPRRLEIKRLHQQNRRSDIDKKWNSVDWNLRDIDLAALFGVSRERVRQVRSVLGKNKSPNQKRHPRSVAAEQWIIQNRNILSAATLSEAIELCPHKISKTLFSKLAARNGISLVAPKWANNISKENLHAFVKIDVESGCWNLPLNNSLSYPRIGKQNAHRFVFKLFYGDIPDDRWVLHRCDNKQCVNPDHLYAGSPRENAVDRKLNGHDSSGPLFDAETVIRLRKAVLAGEKTIAEICRERDTDYGTVSRMIRGTTYKKVALGIAS